jgi:hypothetical protein
VSNINIKNDSLNEDRFQINKRIKIQRLKYGMIIAIIAGTLFIVSQSLTAVNYQEYYADYKKAEIDYDNGDITYEEYNDRRNQYELELYKDLWVISILSTGAKVGVYIAFVFIIVFLISIVLDGSFNKKMRRLALGISGIFLLALCYPIFFAPNPVVYFMP